jgi:hypothetical protein
MSLGFKYYCHTNILYLCMVGICVLYTHTYLYILYTHIYIYIYNYNLSGQGADTTTPANPQAAHGYFDPIVTSGMRPRPHGNSAMEFVTIMLMFVIIPHALVLRWQSAAPAQQSSNVTQGLLVHQKVLFVHSSLATHCALVKRPHTPQTNSAAHLCFGAAAS